MSCSIRTILYATDLQPDAARACELVVHLASALHAEVHVVHVIEPTFPQSDVLELDLNAAPDIRREVSEEVRSRLAQVRDGWGRPEGLVVPFQHIRVLVGVATDTILLEAERVGADMLIVGTHQRGLLGRLLHGSTARSVLTHSPIPVLVVPLGTDDATFPRGARERP